VRLTRKKYRDKEERYLIEGENLIGEALSEEIDISALLIRDGTTFNGSDRVDTYIIEPGLFDSIAQTETSQGVLAVVAKKKFTVATLAEVNKRGINFIVLDRLQDPGNIGTIIRTAEGAGYGAVITVKGTADVYSPKVVRAAAGSVFRIPIVSVEDGRELRETVDRLGKRLAVTCLNNDKFYYDEDIRKDIALVIGNEGGGCSPDLINDADIRVMIPMKGKLDSLNASVAAGILMYEAMRQ
ncbi:MAG: RNA methyltransferase, partial [Clostridiales bacterium]|nr:RNA methyltransferase [Clostridiales bacterium]